MLTRQILSHSVSLSLSLSHVFAHADMHILAQNNPSPPTCFRHS